MPLAAAGHGLVPGALAGGPGWVEGIYGSGLGLGGGAYYGFLCLAFLSYLAVLAGAPALPPRLLWAWIGALVLVFALAPPLLSQDVFSYISEARLGVVHGLNPYLAVPADVPTDPAFAHVGWIGAPSAYGPVFTLATYPTGALSVPVALWALKAAAAASVLGLAAVCAHACPARGVDPRAGAAFVALNPLVLVHVVGGAHNDGLMMILAIAGCSAVLAGREGAGGAMLFAATAVKVTALFAAPFALIGSARRRRFLAGFALIAVLVAAASLVAFGTHTIEDVALAGEHQGRISHYSLPSTAARILDLGAGPVRDAALAVYALVVAWLLVRTLRGGDWLEAAGWAALGLLVVSGWLLPWYVAWALPLAALSRNRALAAGVLALTAFQLINRVPL